MRLFLSAILVALFTLPAAAERMSGQAVAQMMSQGPLRFEAGSVFRITGQGQYEFDHRSSSESGTFQVFSNGEVEIYDEASGDTIRFYFTQTGNGKPALTYLSGPARGNTYPLR